MFLFCFSAAIFAAGKAVLLNIDGPIGPATQDYVERGIAYAEKAQASVIILEINTPGGLDTAMRGINSAIIASPIPVIAYVAPAGARAASAGTFILYASHLAAMAEGTNLGAASPISLASSDKEKGLTTAEKKATNDAAAYLRSLAELRGRSADWGESAVKKAASISATEAKRLNVINEIAANQTELLQKVNGHLVKVKGQNQTLKTAGIAIEKATPDWRYQFLSFLTNPNIAYLLMLVAMYGLFFELANPGLILPGVAGIISLLLVLYAFQLMPINYVGLALIMIGVAFIIFEIYVSSFGVIGFGGIIAFIIGSVMLFDLHDANYRVDWILIFVMSAFSAAFFFFIMNLAIRSHKKAVTSGREGLINSEGIVLNIMNEKIMVRVMGEIWEARSTHHLKPGQIIKVIDVKGLTLIVEPIEL